LLGPKSSYVEHAPEDSPDSSEPVTVSGESLSEPTIELAPKPPVQPEVLTSEVSQQPTEAPPSIPVTPNPVNEVESSPSAPAPQSQLQIDELTQEATEKVEALLAKIPRHEYLEDSIIQKIIADFKASHLGLRKHEVELDDVRSHWDERVRQVMNTEETKRIQFEGLVEQTKIAKTEYELAVKNRKNIEKVRKNEISSKEKHIKETNKTINQVEKALERRVRDLEKERKQISEQHSN
jgi:hypothetical protein